ncbi:hypothetical protein L1987_57575 [Smallanthus sonchifolius]|uniref:Uncharacterized protein n=1 Tax=Smallanthus sonchifolius TaxID=185202 RepID=A0ACB9DDD8_9ASTR|nr:hypothetical protein L1987_57575 [Smallanthus sonchifolius]
MFGFVRFIEVHDLQLLVRILRTIWTMVLSDDDVRVSIDVGCCVIGQVHDIQCIEYLMGICDKEGFHNAHWGDIIFLDDDQEESMTIEKVCIRTKSFKEVMEVCKVMIKKVPYKVDINELSPGSPSICGVDKSEEEDVGVNLNLDVDLASLPSSKGDDLEGGWIRTLGYDLKVFKEDLRNLVNGMGKNLGFQ